MSNRTNIYNTSAEAKYTAPYRKICDKHNKYTPRHYYAKIPHSTVNDNRLVPITRQVLYILELKAGASRVAHITQAEIVDITCTHPNSIYKAIKQLENYGYITDKEPGQYRLKPVSSTAGKFVSAPEALILSTALTTWEIHLLIFILARWKGGKYELNRLGKDGILTQLSDNSNYCRIPGSGPHRHQMQQTNLNSAIQKFIDLGIMQIVQTETTTSLPLAAIDLSYFTNNNPSTLRPGGDEPTGTAPLNNQAVHTLRPGGYTHSAPVAEPADTHSAPVAIHTPPRCNIPSNSPQNSESTQQNVVSDGLVKSINILEEIKNPPKTVSVGSNIISLVETEPGIPIDGTANGQTTNSSTSQRPDNQQQHNQRPDNQQQHNQRPDNQQQHSQR